MCVPEAAGDIGTERLCLARGTVLGEQENLANSSGFAAKLCIDLGLNMCARPA